MIIYKGITYSDNQIFAIVSKIAESMDASFKDVANEINNIMLSEARKERAFDSIKQMAKEVSKFQEISITKNDIFMDKQISKQKRRGKNKGVF